MLAERTVVTGTCANGSPRSNKFQCELCWSLFRHVNYTCRHAQFLQIKSFFIWSKCSAHQRKYQQYGHIHGHNWATSIYSRELSSHLGTNWSDQIFICSKYILPPINLSGSCWVLSFCILYLCHWLIIAIVWLWGWLYACSLRNGNAQLMFSF